MAKLVSKHRLKYAPVRYNIDPIFTFAIANAYLVTEPKTGLYYTVSENFLRHSSNRPNLKGTDIANIISTATRKCHVKKSELYRPDSKY